MEPLVLIAQTLIDTFQGQDIGNMIVACILIAISVIGTASVIVKPLETIAEKTPNETDDKIVGVIKAVLQAMTDFLNKLSLNKKG